jgi:hypothetical protein
VLVNARWVEYQAYLRDVWTEVRPDPLYGWGCHIARRMLRDANISQYLRLDLGAAIHYTAMVGNGFVEAGQPERGLEYCDVALRASYVVPDIGFPFLAYQGKARALLALHRNAEAEAVLKNATGRACGEQGEDTQAGRKRSRSAPEAYQRHGRVWSLGLWGHF